MEKLVDDTYTKLDGKHKVFLIRLLGFPQQIPTSELTPCFINCITPKGLYFEQ